MTALGIPRSAAIESPVSESRSTMRSISVRLLFGCAIAVSTASCQTSPETQSPKRAERTEESNLFRYTHSIGERGSEPGNFVEPIGIAVDDAKNLYVSEGGNDRLQKLTSDGDSLAVWAEGIGRPMHIALDGNGRLVVPAYGNDEIYVFDGAENEVDSFGGDWVDGPAGVSVGPEGRFYVADFYNHRFHIVSADGSLAQTIGKKGAEPGQFTYPTDIEVTPNGEIWVADAYAHRIQFFSADGTHRETLGEKGADKPGQFHVATGIDRGPNGNLYVADFKNDRVQVLNPNGEPIAILDGDGDDDDSISRPTDVLTTPERLYVVDHGNHQIDVYSHSMP